MARFFLCRWIESGALGIFEVNETTPLPIVEQRVPAAYCNGDDVVVLLVFEPDDRFNQICDGLRVLGRGAGVGRELLHPIEEFATVLWDLARNYNDPAWTRRG